MSIAPTYSGEVQLAGWRESHTSGATITLWLADPADLDVFRALTARKGNVAGQRFMAVLVEIGDDELPVQPPAAAPAPAETEKPKGGPLSKLAGQWCQMPNFIDWLRPVYDRHMGGNGLGWGDVVPSDFNGGSAEWAAHALRVICDVESRAELDHDAAAAMRFHTFIRDPFKEHLSHHQPA